MAKAFNVNEVRPYILKADRELPPEQQTEFDLAVVDSALHAYLWDSNTFVGDDSSNGEVKPMVQVRAFSKIRDTVKFCLKSWRKFDGPEFTPKFLVSYPNVGGKNRMGLTNEALDYLKPYIPELSSAIEEENKLSEQDEKNSNTPSQRS